MHHDFGTVPATGVTDQQQRAALRCVTKAADDGGWTPAETLDVLQAIGLVASVPGRKRKGNRESALRGPQTDSRDGGQARRPSGPVQPSQAT